MKFIVGCMGDGIVNTTSTEFFTVDFDKRNTYVYYNFDGKFYNLIGIGIVQAEPTLFYRKGEDKYLTERPELTLNASELKMDTLLVVSNYGDDDIVTRYFSHHTKNGIYCFNYGSNSITTDGNSNKWDCVELYGPVIVGDKTYPAGTKVVNN